MTNILVVLLVVAFVLAAEALRERRHDRHGLERRVVLYAGAHESRISARLGAIRRAHVAAPARAVAGGTQAPGRRVTDRMGGPVRA